MKQKKIFLIAAAIFLIAAAGSYWLFGQKKGGQPLDPKTNLEQYLAAKRQSYLTGLNLSEISLNKIFETILRIETELTRRPQDYQNLVQVGILYQRLHEYDLAKEKFERAIEVLPGEGLAYANLAELNVFYFKDFTSAEQNYKKAIENDYWRVDYYRSLADLYRSEFPEKKAEIEGLMLGGIEKNPGKKVEFYSYLVEFFWNEGQLDKALAYTKKILAIEPANEYYQQTAEDLQAELAK